MVDITTLETKRLRLRQWKAKDYAPCAAMCADMEVMEFFPEPLSEAQSNNLADGLSYLISENGWGFWAIETKTDNCFIGFVGLNKQKADALPFAPLLRNWLATGQGSLGQGLCHRSRSQRAQFCV